MRIYSLTVVLIGLMSLAAWAQSTPPNETQKIDLLISSIRDLKDATFIRNGKEYDGDAAAKHLREKVDYAGDKIKTARNFIDEIASKSSMSGKPYTIKFKDGTVQTSAAFLSARLEELEHPKPTSQPAP